MDSLLTNNTYYNKLKSHYQLSNTEQAYCLVRVVLGIGLRYIVENVKAETPNLKIARVVKDEVKEVANISISSLDKYLGETFKSKRQIDSTTLDKLSIPLFYHIKNTNHKQFKQVNFKYLREKHIGILGHHQQQPNTDKFIIDLIEFIKSKPLLIDFIRDNVNQSECPQIIKHVFGLTTKIKQEPTYLSSNYLRSELNIPQINQQTHIGLLNSKQIILIASFALLIGVSLPVSIFMTSSAHPSLVLDYLLHDPGKHFFHIVLFPCIIWAFLSCISCEHLRSHKSLIFILIAAGFVSMFGQTYIQHTQSICDLSTSNYACNDVVDRLFNNASLDRFFLLFTSFLSLLASLSCVVVFACQLLDVKNRKREILSPLIYSLINMSFIVWAVFRAYSEWHEVSLSFTPAALTEFVIHQYQSFLMIISILIISQILVLIQVSRRKAVWVYSLVFIITDLCGFWLATNIHTIAPKFHSVNHLNFSQTNSISIVLGPLVYWYFLAMIIVFVFFNIVNKVRRDHNR